MAALEGEVARRGGTIMNESLVEAVVRLAGFVHAWGRPCALVGGAAIIARVQPRLTIDLDLVIVVPAGGSDAVLSLAREHGYDYDEQETREFIEGGLARLWGPPGTPDGVGVDLLFVDSPFLESVVVRATPVEIAGTSLPVASVEDLLLMKIEADRPHDLDDAIAIKDAFADQLDRDYVRRWAAALGIKARIDALLEAKEPD